MSDEISIVIDTKTEDGYNTFIKCKTLPVYKVIGNTFITNKKSYEYVFGSKKTDIVKHIKNNIEFDYQSYLVKKALERERFSIFADCGLGKTICELMFAHDVVNSIGGKGLIQCPLSVIEDIQRECKRLYGYRMSNLRHDKWNTDIAIVNYEGMRDVPTKDLSVFVLDESSILKSGTGEIAEYLKRVSANVKFRLACSATPSPNDQTEYASHAVFLGICSTIKEFYSRFFVKDGTEWRMKGHAKDAFYDFLKSWSCYIKSPSKLGFERGAELEDEPEYIILESFANQKYMPDGKLFSDSITLSDSFKVFGDLRCDRSEKRFIDSIESVKNDRSIIWCNRNNEESVFAKELNASIINGSTPLEKRIEIIDAFKCGQIDKIVSKPKVLGFGVNIQEAESHLLSGYTFSFEQMYQAIRRSHRYGRKGRLKVYVPVSEPERPVWEILQNKLKTFESDVIELQSRFFN